MQTACKYYYVLDLSDYLNEIEIQEIASETVS